ncbi:MAG: hypothetical protein ACI4FZ_11385 [Lachnospiraceae bacterium]
MKYFVKVMVLTTLFFGSIYFFGSNMDETVFDIDSNTTKMAEAKLPTVELRSDGVTCNLLHGYTTNLDLMSVREHLISVEEEQMLELLIDERESEVRKLQYEVVNVSDGKEVASDTVNAFDKEEGLKVARLKVTEKMTSGQEYAVKVTLITSESKRIYYYFRMKYYQDAHLAEKADFILSFSENARNKRENAVIPYLESTYRDEGDTYAYVDIKDSFYMVCWGDLKPVVITEPELQISELYSNIAVATLKYMVELTNDTGVEKYYITEKFRIICTDSAKHLLNYERTMEAAFDVALVSLSQSQFKIGVTTETELELIANADNSMLTFVRNKELWHYNLAENKLSKVFSFRGEETYEVREAYDQHDIRVLNLYENGDVSFMVYGYMNRGEYEGKTGIVLYRYYRAEDRIEEMLYLPVNETYQNIRQELGSFSYMNEYDVFFFMAYRTLYSYNLITQELRILSDSAMEDSVVFSREKGYVAWQENEDYSRIHLIYLESGEHTELPAPEGEFVRMLGKIDENMLCGYGLLSDCTVSGAGELLYPAYQVQITDAAKGVLKTYQKEGYYVYEADTSENSIRLSRVTKTEKNGGLRYEEAEDDYILNRDTVLKKPISLTSRITELMFIEYYISFPSAYVMKELPSTAEALHTVIKEDPTVRISELERAEEEYLVYSFGEIIARHEDCADAIRLADLQKNVGTVVSDEGKVIWERGIKYAAYYLSGFQGVSCKESGLTSRQAAVKAMLAFQGVNADVGELSEQDSVKEFLSNYLAERVLSLNGITLDEALYFVYKGSPVFVMKDAENAVLLTGYNSAKVEYYDPKTGQTKTLSLTDAEEMFSEAGSIYISIAP